MAAARVEPEKETFVSCGQFLDRYPHTILLQPCVHNFTANASPQLPFSVVLLIHHSGSSWGSNPAYQLICALNTLPSHTSCLAEWTTVANGRRSGVRSTSSNGRNSSDRLFINTPSLSSLSEPAIVFSQSYTDSLHILIDIQETLPSCSSAAASILFSDSCIPHI